MFTLMQTVPAAMFRGRAIRLRGQVRATPDGMSGAALWLRVDRESGQPGFFDNMSDRQIRSPEWHEYAIEGAVAADATNIAFGVMALGSVTADFDQIELAVQDGNDRWASVAIKDPGFEAAAADGWARVPATSTVMVTQPTPAPEGRQFLRMTPAARPPITAEIFDNAPPNAGDHVDFDLGLGLQARVPLALTDSDAGVRQSSTAPAAEPGASRGATADSPDLATRLADVIVAWNVFRHFYPYWNEVNVDWDGRLLSYLNAASMATTRRDELEVLGQLVADARDGHGRVQDLRVRERQAWLPIQLALVENQVVVSASRAHDAPVGAIVTTIEGMPARQRIARDSQRWSGTAQWKTAQALRYVAAGATGSLVSIGLNAGSGSHALDLRRDAAEPAPESRPEPIAELSPGLSYVDLTRVPWAQVVPRLEALSHATGIVFDVRGYPTDAGLPILRHLLDAPESDLWMHIPKIVGPFGATAGSLSVGWNLRPATPHLGAKVVFLTDARAISYAESVLGYVASHRLGTIVGATTAGTNGNVATFSMPAGFAIAFTGMRVTQHDGTPHHLVGIRPDIAVSPTIEGLRSGHDEVLERGLTVVGTSR